MLNRTTIVVFAYQADRSPLKGALTSRSTVKTAQDDFAYVGVPAFVSRAFGAVAETGTLVLTSGADNPTTLNFLPEAHMVLINASDVLGSYEEAWDRLRTVYGEATLPRTVNMISGPWRTADIEQTLVRGAHGPRRLHVMVVGETE